MSGIESILSHINQNPNGIAYLQQLLQICNEKKVLDNRTILHTLSKVIQQQDSNSIHDNTLLLVVVTSIVLTLIDKDDSNRIVLPILCNDSETQVLLQCLVQNISTTEPPLLSQNVCTTNTLNLF
jgi:hypothetical protein